MAETNNFALKGLANLVQFGKRGLKILTDTSDDYFSFSDETYTSYTGFDYDLGTQYTVHNNIRIKQRIKGDTIGQKKVRTVKLSHTFGATYNSGSTLNGDGYRYAETFFGRKFDGGVLTSIDTLIFEDNKKSTASKPSGFGLAYTLSNGEKWAFSAEFEQNEWSSVINTANGNTFFDNTKYMFGFE